MPKSMTGYGQAQGPVLGRRLTLEVKSVNHKFCEVNLRIASTYASLEPRAVEMAKKYFKRGRIDIFVRDEKQNGTGAGLEIDLKKLKTFHSQLQKSAKALKIPSEVDLKTLLSFPQFFLVQEDDLEEFWQGMGPLLERSFKKLDAMRKKEGRAIAKFLKEQLAFLESHMKTIIKMVPKTVKHHRDHLRLRVEKLTENLELDPQRLIQEIAYMVDRTDISEELQRLSHHAKHFHTLLQKQELLGRKLDFLLQEMNREVNTLSAKVQDASISQQVVECKHALEKMREQVQNLE